MENLYLYMILPILVYDFSHTSVWKHASVWRISKRKRNIYVYGAFKSMEEKSYFRMRYL